ncbi:sugar ABC transporter substrate-binding protein [Alicyclobacillus cycloheptanicus]|uniref:D-xylose transport system substrate-binding protein n=1 Tax=Alicyclobacillus cycloheptanicus TaxID=1457 RepID=A0ABT9XM79_9BACL|nr:sugar ABC transporter substrate-binding protein [Alicyclobacillus cycloheptanicus]MDQ0191421.1 D-xylose transport system substrate-binding protein [Alicyclobacillus cycloheptanicus]WDM02135.1 sugar ABC transporter substrate-binding protein [Alicyclobacillus cycloheptanicus]
MKQKKGIVAGIAVIAAMTLATACGSSGGGNGTSNGSGGSGSKGGKMIALLLPDTTSSARYETQDKPDFEKEVKALDPSITVDYENAQGSDSTQQQQAEAAITNGAQVLVIDPVDSQSAATIVNEANQAGVKVISYDRMIENAKVDYYVSFDNEEVGKLQGEYIAQHTPKGGTVVMIDGAQTDNNALQFAQGAHAVLDPLFKSGQLRKGYESYTPNWDPSNGQREMEAALTKLNNKVNAVLAANDGLAGAVIQALAAQGLAGKVPVTGQDATDAGLHDIMQGTQSMTVYKAVPKEAKLAAELAVDIVDNKPIPSSLVNTKVNNGAEDVPAALLQPVVVTKQNIQSTVIKDGFTTMQKIEHPSS